MPSFVEFFAGGGLARLGLGAAWTCVMANDVCSKKAATYRANFGQAELVLQDVRTLGPAAVPAADLWWASFPCQDHSSAGGRTGFAGDRGMLVFEITRLLDAALAAGTAPRLVVMENVTGFVRARDGKDFTSLMTALTSAGYRVGAVMMNARDFVPQSRERMIIVAVAGDAEIPVRLAKARPDKAWHTKLLVRAVGKLPPSVAKRWVWWTLPRPPAHGAALIDMLDPAGGADQKWLPAAQVDAMLANVTPLDAARLEKAKAEGRLVAATTSATRRDTRAGSSRVRTIRTDGVAGCLLTRATTNRQQLMTIDGDAIGIRHFTAGELARLIGVPADYRLPRSTPQAVRLTGDGVVVPVARWLAANLLEPLLAGTGGDGIRPMTAAHGEPPDRVRRKRKVTAEGGGGGIKSCCRGTTTYLLPEESERLHAIAAEMGVGLQGLIILALDGLLARRGEQPVRRYGAG